MRRKYTRLKLKMLLFVVAGTLIAGLAGLFLLEVVVDGVLQDPFARFLSGRPARCSARASMRPWSSTGRPFAATSRRF